MPAGQQLLSFGIQKYRPGDQRQKAKVRSVAMNLVVDCDLPIYCVERAGFKRFLEDEDARYSPISSMLAAYILLLNR